MIFKTNFLAILVMMLFFTELSAQKLLNLCGEETYYASGTVSLDQAKREALELAKAKALAEKFGTRITQSATTMSSLEYEKFFFIGDSEVKGEWMEDTKGPEYKISYQNDMLVVQVSVCGKAREVTGAGIDFSAKVLKNGTKDRFESHEFRNGDDIFLSFRSPVEGYLAVYLVDDSETAYCLLPYMKDPTGKVNIKSGKDYVFFSAKHAERSETARVDEYVLTCEKEIEHNYLYIIFSPNEFTKANDLQAEVLLPRELSFDDFQRWLTRSRQRDKNMKVNIKGLTIKK